MDRVIFDIETDGLLDDLTKIHCIAVKDADTGETRFFGPESVEEGVDLLSQAKMFIGHNILDFDLRAIEKVFPRFSYESHIFDTLIAVRTVWPDVKLFDMKAIEKHGKGAIPGDVIGRHSLAAWGFRLGFPKDTYEKDMKEAGLDPWSEYNNHMGSYCQRDVEVTHLLFKKILSKKTPSAVFALEHGVANVVNRQVRNGFYFDKDKAASLLVELREQQEKIRSELVDEFGSWCVPTNVFTPKKDNRTLGYTEGVPFTKVVWKTFNPASRDHIANRLMKLRGWKPEAYTDKGSPIVDEQVLSKLPYPEAKPLSRYLMLQKRIGQLADGPEAWLKVEVNNRVHGRVNTNGANTGRMTHFKPNMAQVPAVRAPYGEECRSLFKATPGWELVGIDADSLELRCLAGYMAKYDDGEYVKTVLEGNKELGTDMHTQNANTLGVDRDTAKVFFYAFIYGAGTEKLGKILSGGKRKGKQARDKFLSSLPALKKVIDNTQAKAAKDALTAVDGRHLHCRSAHSSFNTLLQSAGAIFMKRALVIFDKDLQEEGLEPGFDYEFVANVHDEWQIETKPDVAEEVAEIGKQSIVKAGEFYEFRCPLAADAKIGTTWADTH